MEECGNTLRGMIYSKYDSMADCARAMGWSRQRLNNLTNGRKKPDVEEAIILADALGTDVATIVKFFLQR